MFKRVCGRKVEGHKPGGRFNPAATPAKTEREKLPVGALFGAPGKLGEQRKSAGQEMTHGRAG